MTLSIAYSPCPNDTFIFDAMVNGKIDTGGIQFTPVLKDVQALNEDAIHATYDISKISYAVLPFLSSDYLVMNTGSALGSAVGPLLIHHKSIGLNGISPSFDERVAIPGEHTTAHLLFSLAYPEWKNKIFLRYDQIEQYVLEGRGPGVIIHENRFTYQSKGLHLWHDLGAYWENKMKTPIPLGGIVVRKSLDYPLQKSVESIIADSINYAFSHYPELSEYVKKHAQEMNEEVMRLHINLYVNEFSTSLGSVGRKAVRALMEQCCRVHQIKGTEKDVFLA